MMSRNRMVSVIRRDAGPPGFLRLVLAILVSLSCPRFIMADGDGAMTTQIVAVVEQLEDPSFEKREEATRRLGELIDFDVNLLSSFLEDSELSAEQRNRLLRVYHDKLTGFRDWFLRSSSACHVLDSSWRMMMGP